MRACLMRLFHLVAIGALGERRGVQVIVRTPLILAPLGMAPFGIRHTDSFKKPLTKGGILFFFPLGWLLLLEPVLPDSSQRRQAGICGVGLAAAILGVQIRAALRTQAAAIAAANHFHRQSQ